MQATVPALHAARGRACGGCGSSAQRPATSLSSQLLRWVRGRVGSLCASEVAISFCLQRGDCQLNLILLATEGVLKMERQIVFEDTPTGPRLICPPYMCLLRHAKTSLWSGPASMAMHAGSGSTRCGAMR